MLACCFMQERSSSRLSTAPPPVPPPSDSVRPPGWTVGAVDFALAEPGAVCAAAMEQAASHRPACRRCLTFIFVLERGGRAGRQGWE